MTNKDAGEIMSPSVPARRALLLLLVALLVAAAVLLGAIFPVELRWDPLGLGRITGLSRLSEPVATPQTQTKPASSTAYQGNAPFSTITLSIPLKAGGDPQRQDEIEYKVAMEPGQMIVYSWDTAGAVKDDEFYSDFHGHVVTSDPANVSATIYRESMGASASGGLAASFAGVHGWYFQNQSDHDVVVKLKVSGFFQLVPPGKPGNEAGLVPDRP